MKTVVPSEDDAGKNPNDAYDKAKMVLVNLLIKDSSVGSGFFFYCDGWHCGLLILLEG